MVTASHRWRADDKRLIRMGYVADRAGGEAAVGRDISSIIGAAGQFTQPLFHDPMPDLSIRPRDIENDLYQKLTASRCAVRIWAM